MDMKKMIAAAVLVVMASLILTAYSVTGGFPGLDAAASVRQITGDVSVTHEGLNYTLKEGIDLSEGDRILVGRNASCTIEAAGGLTVFMSTDSICGMVSNDADEFVMEISEGAVFLDAGALSGTDAVVTFGNYRAVPAPGAVFSCEIYPGAQTVSCFSGSVTFSAEGQSFLLTEGELVSAVQNSNGSELVVSGIVLSELRDDILICLMNSSAEGYDTAAIEDILSLREQETASRMPEEGVPGETLYATIEIRCDTVIPRIDDLPNSLAMSIPRDGVILPETSLSFEYGQTVFDLLTLACVQKGIRLDYKYLPIIRGYYITGIGGLSEFDCGKESGWLYRVNGWYPNYGCYSCYLADGDRVVFTYTCEGYGTDLGREEGFDTPKE